VGRIRIEGEKKKETTHVGKERKSGGKKEKRIESKALRLQGKTLRHANSLGGGKRRVETVE